MALRLHNTLTKQVEASAAADGGPVRLYTCGPTVYDYAHIGNLRSYIFADVLRRALEANGHAVEWVMNITDVDDKTIRGAIGEFGIRAGVKELREFTDRYLAAFKRNLEDVNIPTDSGHVTFVRVSDVIPQIAEFIKELLRKGYAYQTEDGTFFSIEKYQNALGDYGDLVGAGFLAGKKIGARVKVDEYEKEDLSDFALWKAKDPADGNIFWSDPELGDGRPGWHIECSVINRVAFGDSPTDIHTGGVDLIFPHHTNEIAQSQALAGKGNFVRHWAHAEHLMVEGRKMAKSAGNFHTLEDLKGAVPDAGMAFRYLALQTHYRSQMNFIPENLQGAYAGLERLQSIGHARAGEPLPPELREDFMSALNNDLNTPQALAVLSKAEGVGAWQLLDALGLISDSPLFEGSKPLLFEEIPAEVSALLAAREEARSRKDFALSDELRDRLAGMGYAVEDTPDGTQVRKKQ